MNKTKLLLLMPLLSVVLAGCSFNNVESGKKSSNEPAPTSGHINTSNDPDNSSSSEDKSSSYETVKDFDFAFKNIEDGYELTVSATNKATFDSWTMSKIPQNDKSKLKDVKELVFGNNIEIIEYPTLNEMTLRKISFSKDVRHIKEGFHYTSNNREFYGYYFAGDCPIIDAPFFDDSWPVCDSYIYYEPNTKGWDAFSIQGNIVLPTNYVKPTIEEYTVESYATLAVEEFNRMMTVNHKKMVENNEEALFLIPNTKNVNEYNEIKDFAIELTQGLETDEQKCDAIYKWLVDNIEYTKMAMNYTAYTTFKEKKGVCAQITELMRDMLTSLGIVSSAVRCIPNNFITSVERAIRNGVYEDDGETHKLVSVFLNDKTYYYDATWKTKYKTNYERVAKNYTLFNIDSVAVIPQSISPLALDNGFFGSFGYMAWIGDHLYGFQGNKISAANCMSFAGNFVFTCDFQCNCWYDGWKGLPKGAAVISNFSTEGNFSQLAYCRSDGLSSNVMTLYKFLQTEEKLDYLYFLIDEKLSNIKVIGDFIVNTETNMIVWWDGVDEILTIPNKINDISIKGLDLYAISDNNYVKEIRFEEGITAIEMHSIYNCQSLKKIYLPSTLCDRFGDAFDYHEYINSNGMIEQFSYAIARHCLNLEQYNIPTSSPYYITKNHSLYSKDGKVLLALPPKCPTLDLEGVQYVTDNACEHCCLENVTFPNSIKELGTESFAYSSLLRSVKFLGETLLTDSGYVHSIFANCPFLSDVSLPNKQEVIGLNMFRECFSLYEITLPETIKKINGSAFIGSGLVHINLPRSLEEIAEYAFLDCENLYDIDNSSSLNLKIEDESYGCVAKYAKDLSTQSYTFNKDGYIFFANNNVKSLLSYVGDIDNDTITLPSNINGESYSVYGTFFHQGGEYYYNSSAGTSSFVLFPLYTPMHFIKKVYVPQGISCGDFSLPDDIEVIFL